MANQAKLDTAYMECAYAMAKLSHAKRKKVGAILVSPGGGIIAEGVNGMPTNFNNTCEEVEVVCKHDWDVVHTHGPKALYRCMSCSDEIDNVAATLHGLSEKKTTLITKPECLHAESNAIAKVARSTSSSIGGTMYSTLSPCFECAKLIIQSGIVRVVYGEQYPYPGHKGPVRVIGLDLLREADILVDILPLDGHNVKDAEL